MSILDLPVEKINERILKDNQSRREYVEELFRIHLIGDEYYIEKALKSMPLVEEDEEGKKFHKFLGLLMLYIYLINADDFENEDDVKYFCLLFKLLKRAKEEKLHDFDLRPFAPAFNDFCVEKSER